MATEWYIKTTDGERGPFTFSTLVEQMASGRLQDDDLVRNSDELHWRSTEEIPGLHRMALRLTQKTATETSKRQSPTTPSSQLELDLIQKDSPKANSAAHYTESIPITPAGGHRHSAASPFLLTLILVTLLLAALAGWFAWDQFAQQRRFPMPARVQPVPRGFHLPLLGTVSTLELLLLLMDAVIVCGLLLTRVRRKRRPKSTDTPTKG